MNIQILKQRLHECTQHGILRALVKRLPYTVIIYTVILALNYLLGYSMPLWQHALAFSVYALLVALPGNIKLMTRTGTYNFNVSLRRLWLSYVIAACTLLIFWFTGHSNYNPYAMVGLLIVLLPAMLFFDWLNYQH